MNLATDVNAAARISNRRAPSSLATTFTFTTSGTHTMRIRQEDGVQLDQIVLSSSQFRSAGSVTNDNTY